MCYVKSDWSIAVLSCVRGKQTKPWTKEAVAAVSNKISALFQTFLFDQMYIIFSHLCIAGMRFSFL